MRRDGTLNWIEVIQLGATVRTKFRELRLGVLEAEGQWGVLALETSLASRTPEDVFGDHAHKIVGKADSRGNAMALAEKYAKEWLRGKRLEERCLCEEIRVTTRQNARKKDA